MLHIIKTNVLLPLATRLGSITTGLLVGWGLNSVHSNWVGTGVAGLLLISTDLLLAWMRKLAITNQAVARVLAMLEGGNGVG